MGWQQLTWWVSGSDVGIQTARHPYMESRLKIFVCYKCDHCDNCRVTVKYSLFLKPVLMPSYVYTDIVWDRNLQYHQRDYWIATKLPFDVGFSGLSLSPKSDSIFV